MAMRHSFLTPASASLLIRVCRNECSRASGSVVITSITRPTRCDSAADREPYLSASDLATMYSLGSQPLMKGPSSRQTIECMAPAITRLRLAPASGEQFGEGGSLVAFPIGNESDA